jgi:hypothetical protein
VLLPAQAKKVRVSILSCAYILLLRFVQAAQQKSNMYTAIAAMSSINDKEIKNQGGH